MKARLVFIVIIVLLGIIAFRKMAEKAAAPNLVDDLAGAQSIAAKKKVEDQIAKSLALDAKRNEATDPDAAASPHPDESPSPATLPSP